MKISIKELASIVNGKIEGDENALIEQISPIESCDTGSITFFANPKYEEFIYQINGGVVITSLEFEPSKPTKATLLKVENVQKTLSDLLEKFGSAQEHPTGIEQPSFFAENVEYGNNFYLGAFSYIGKNSKMGKNVKIYPNVYIGKDCIIADNTIIYSGVKVYPRTEIGSDCIIHSGAVIGADGFGFAPIGNGEYKKIPQTGKVIIKNNVEIGANTTIDRATLTSTMIEEGVKLDNLIQIAHNVVIGKNTVMAAQAGVSGSTKIGKNSMVGGQVGIVGHIEIADSTHIGAQSGIAKSIKLEGTKWFGSPAVPYREAIKKEANIREIEGLKSKIAELEETIKNIQIKLKS